MNKICTTSIQTPGINHLLEDTVFFFIFRGNILIMVCLKNKYDLSFM